jgi:hypothetical protein
MSAAAFRRAVACALAIAALAAPARAREVPYLSGRVVDEASMLSPSAAAGIAEALRAYEDSTGNQFVVLIIPSLGGESLEEGRRQRRAAPHRARRPEAAHRGRVRARGLAHGRRDVVHHHRRHPAALQGGRLRRRRA